MIKRIKRSIALIVTLIMTLGIIQNYDEFVYASENLTFEDFTYVVSEEGTAEITSYTGTLRDVVIPKQIEDYKVTSIAGWAFFGCWDIDSVTISEYINNIDLYAFSDSGLKMINVSENNQKYSSVDGILYNKNITELICCPEEKSGIVVIPESVERIGEHAFLQCSKLQYIEIPDSVTEIGEYAFCRVHKLDILVIPDGVKEIKEGTFQNCLTTSIVIPESVTKIDDYGLWCWNLKNIYYTGSKDEWEKIDIHESNYYDGTNPEEGTYGFSSDVIQYNYENKSVYMLGSVDGDESIDASDSLLVLKYAAKITDFNYKQLLAADTSKDGNINASDALLILKYAAKLIDHF